jgi:hypothetical protein
MIQVIDNVVGSRYQDAIESTFYSNNFLWKCNPNISGDGVNTQFGLTHQIVDNMSTTSNFADFVYPLIYEISDKSGVDYGKVYNARAFLQVPMNSKKDHDVFHVDTVFPHMVFLYYVNDSDGDTIILNKLYKEGTPNFLERDYDYSSEILEKVTPKRGRVVVFDGNHYHAGGIPQKEARCVLNFNLIN